MRVQCKYSARKGDVIVVRMRTTHCPDLERCYLLPIGDFEGQGHAHLRLARSRNNQEQGVRMAAPYELGAIAQLGERLTGSQKVAGSSPASSTAKAALLGGFRLFEGGA